MIWDLIVLKQTIKRDLATCEFSNYKYCTYKTSIIYKCKCGNEYKKGFSAIYKTGAYCKQCCELRRIQKCKKTCLEKYGETTNLKCKETLEKKKETLKVKYGVENVFQCEEIKEKSKQTVQFKYGVDHISQADTIKEKIVNTNYEKYGSVCYLKSTKGKEVVKSIFLNKYGVENPSQNNEIKEKIKKTMLDKYGVEYPIQNELIKEKIKQTCLQKYGVENPASNQEIQEKIRENCSSYNYKYKLYTFPSGKQVKIQGYENLALDELIKLYPENNIINDRKNVPKIVYNYNTKEKHYIPDIYLLNENKIIEVKSTWTYQIELEKNNIKAKSCVEKGYKYEFWVYDGKFNKTIYTIDSDENKEIKEELVVLA